MIPLTLADNPYVKSWVWYNQGKWMLLGDPVPWCEQVLGYVPQILVVQDSPVSVIFESDLDLLSFTLAWSDYTQTETAGEAAAFYCPYIPLTIHGISNP